MHALLLALMVGQSANIGMLLASHGQFTFVGWDGQTKKDAKFGDPIQLSDELSTEADGMVKVTYADVASVVAGGSSKFSVDKLDAQNINVKIAYGRVRVTLTPGKKVTATLNTEGGSFVFAEGDVAVIKEGGKTQLVVFAGHAEARTSTQSTAVATGEGVDLGGGAYAVGAKSALALKRSLELDETPALAIAQTLETDLPGFVGPKSGHIRWRGPAESFGEGMRLFPPFSQSPFSATAASR